MSLRHITAGEVRYQREREREREKTKMRKRKENLTDREKEIGTFFMMEFDSSVLASVLALLVNKSLEKN